MNNLNIVIPAAKVTFFVVLSSASYAFSESAEGEDRWCALGRNLTNPYILVPTGLKKYRTGMSVVARMMNVHTAACLTRRGVNRASRLSTS